MASIRERGAVRVWRIVKESRIDSALDGEGARLYGGRWNSPGVAAVYTSGSLALASLETLVHLDLSRPLPRFFALAMTVPGLLIEELADSPPRPLPAALEQTQVLGDRWLRGCTALALQVPSAIVPLEFNYLLNPAHAAFDEIEIEPPIPFPMDPRLSRR